MSTETTTWILFFINGCEFYYLLCAFFRSRIKNVFVGASVYAFLCLMVRMLSNQVEDVDTYNSALVIVAVIHTALVYSLFKVKKWYAPLIFEVISMVGMLVLQIPTTVLSGVVTGANMLEAGKYAEYDLNYPITTSLNCMLFMVIIFIVYIVIFAKKYFVSRILLSATMGIVFYQTLVIVLFYVLCLKNGENAIFGGVLFVVFSLLSDMVVLKTVESMLHKQQVEREWATLSAQRQKEYDYYVNVQNAIEQMRLERHDCVNYLQAIERLIGDESNHAEAEKLLNELCKKYTSGE